MIEKRLGRVELELSVDLRVFGIGVGILADSGDIALIVTLGPALFLVTWLGRFR